MQKQFLTRQSLQHVLAEYEERAAEPVTIYTDATTFPGGLGTMLSGTPFLKHRQEIERAAGTELVIREAERYSTGAAILCDTAGVRYIVIPPFPVAKNSVLMGEIDTAPLFETWERKYTIGVVLVKWGTYGIGVFDGEKLVASKVGTGYIHQKQRQGGSSSKRFARRTEEQKKFFLRNVGNRTDEILKAHRLDYIFFGGNRLILRPLMEESRILEAQSAKISGRVLEIQPANQAVLEHSWFEIMKACVFSFEEADFATG